MTITTRDQLIDGLGNNSSRMVLDKASLSNAVAGTYYSLWRATGQPGQGAIPSTAAVCNNTLLGAIGFTQQTAPATSYGAYFYAVTSNNAMTIEIHDRLMHRGGLSGILTTGQAVDIDLLSQLGTSNLSERIGDSNYSDIQWWLEWYADTGATASNATITVVYDDGTAGNLSLVAVGGTVRAGRMLPLNALVGASGKFIRGVTSITLSASTGAAGSFGVTATRVRMSFSCPIANFMPPPADWAALGLPQIANGSCLFPVVICSTTTTGTVRGGGKIAHG